LFCCLLFYTSLHSCLLLFPHLHISVFTYLYVNFVWCLIIISLPQSMK
jgi:hypothetical protein